MSKSNSLLSDILSVHIKKFMKKYRGQLFLITTLSSITILSLLCSVDIKYVIALILLVNQSYDRDNGFHSKSLSHCFVISSALFTLFIYLSSIITISAPMAIIVLMMLDYNKITQHTTLILVFMLGISNDGYGWLMSSCTFSIILSYLLSGTNKQSVEAISKIDNLLYRLLK